MLPLALLLAVNLVPDSPQATYRQPQMASRGDGLAMTFGSGNAVYFTASSDNGKSFLPPRKVAERGALALGRHRGPRICYQSGNIVISAIVGEKGGGQDGDLVVWTSDDNGLTWSNGTRVNNVEGSAREGLHGMTCGGGWAMVTWLDLRTKKTQIYGSISADGGATWQKNFLVYESPAGSVCECCHPSAVLGWGSAIHVMFRNAVGGSRDMYLATSTNAGESWKTVKLGKGTWRINACPMDGGQVDVASNGNPVTVWRREDKIYFTRPDTEEVELGTGKDPSVASGLNNTLYAVWTGKDGVYLRDSAMKEAKLIGPGGAYPHIVFDNGNIVAAWESERGITVQKLP